MHYTGPVVRPPHEADSLLIEVTVGCTHNSCSYCNFYENTCFRMAPLSQIEEDLKELSITNPFATRLYALGGDPFTLSFENLFEFAKLVNKYLPKAMISMYARADSMKSKTVNQLKQLRALGINDLVIGIESGDEDVLRNCNKGYTVSDIIEGCHKLEEAGIEYRAIYLSGLAGYGNGEKNALESVKMFNKIHPFFMYITAVTAFPGTRMYYDIENNKFKEAGELERIKEVRTLLSGLKNEMIVSSETAGSLINFTAEYPKEKDRLLRDLDVFIDKFNEEQEEKMKYYRHTMRNV